MRCSVTAILDDIATAPDGVGGVAMEAEDNPDVYELWEDQIKICGWFAGRAIVPLQLQRKLACSSLVLVTRREEKRAIWFMHKDHFPSSSE